MLNLDQQNSLREQYKLLNPGWQPATEVYADLTRSNIDPASRILDLGCGRGGIIEQLDHSPSLVTGVDPDWKSLTEHRLSSISLALATGAKLPFRSESFDLVLASWLFEHLPQPVQSLREVRRVLKPGGTIAFITPNGRHPVAALNRLLGRLERLQNMIVKIVYGRGQKDTFPTYYRANSFGQLSLISYQADLEQVSLTAVPDPTYLAFSEALFQLARRLEDNLSPTRHIHLVGLLRRPE